MDKSMEAMLRVSSNTSDGMNDADFEDEYAMLAEMDDITDSDGSDVGLLKNASPTEGRLPADQDDTGGSCGLDEGTTTEVAVGEMRICHVGLLMLGVCRDGFLILGCIARPWSENRIDHRPVNLRC